jgi:asparagine synthetase B (glutamine-hydrolysing)
VTSIRVIGELDPNFGWDGTRLYPDAGFEPGRPPPSELRGAATSVRRDDQGNWRILRDPLGLNKLFWARAGDDSVFLAARPLRLIEAGARFDEIRAISPGAVIDMPASDGDPSVSSVRPATWFSRGSGGEASVERTGKAIRSTLTAYLTQIAANHPSAAVFVCLSGGLDSSGIAALAREIFPGLVAVSFDLRRPGEDPSDDRAFAQRLAGSLKIPLVEVTVSQEDLLEYLDLVLVEGIDWRDFNVHTALVNASLADGIRRALTDPAESVIVFTGDLANEFLADYRPEAYREYTYYQLPRLAPSALRVALIRGVETSHREVGIFRAWDLSVVQPYAVAVDAYLALPPSVLGPDHGKARVCRAVFGDDVPEFIYSRDKVRAQIGSAGGGGVLAACIDRGIDRDWLRRRFADLHGVEDPIQLDRFIRAGQYRGGIPSTEVSSRESG